MPREHCEAVEADAQSGLLTTGLGLLPIWRLLRARPEAKILHSVFRADCPHCRQKETTMLMMLTQEAELE